MLLTYRFYEDKKGTFRGDRRTALIQKYLLD